jgi:hypothetical protein
MASRALLAASGSAAGGTGGGGPGTPPAVDDGWPKNPKVGESFTKDGKRYYWNGSAWMPQP